MTERVNWKKKYDELKEEHGTDKVILMLREKEIKDLKKHIEQLESDTNKIETLSFRRGTEINQLKTRVRELTSAVDLMARAISKVADDD